MAQVLTNKLSLVVAATMSNALDLTTQKADINLALAIADLASGTGLNKADKRWSDTRSLASGVYETISMYNFSIGANGGAQGAAGTDDLGAAIICATIKAIIIINNSTSAGEIFTVGGVGASSGFTSFLSPNTATAPVGPGGALIKTSPSSAGMTVTSDTVNCLLKIKNDGSGANTYKIIVIGASA
jgi:hypothetical protein